MGPKYPVHRGADDFVTPYKGSYAWIVKGILKRKGAPPIKVDTKYVCEWGSLNNPYVSMERFRPKWVEKSGVKREDPSTWGIGAGGHDGWTAFNCVKS